MDTLPAEADSEVQRYAALFIDVPNIRWVNPIAADGPQQRLEVDDIDWSLLVDRMLASLEANHFVYIGNAYLFAADGRKRTQDWLKKAMKRGLYRYHRKVNAFVRSVKDIDVAIVNDIWDCFLVMLQEQRSRGKKGPLEVTILLAGGDGAYSYPITSIRNRFDSSEVNIRLHTFSWGGSLHRELTELSEVVELLEKGPSIIKAHTHHC